MEKRREIQRKLLLLRYTQRTQKYPEAAYARDGHANKVYALTKEYLWSSAMASLLKNKHLTEYTQCKIALCFFL